METLHALREGLPLGELIKGLGIALMLSRFLPPFWRGGQNLPGSPSSSSLWAEAIKTGGFFLIFLAARSWLALVNRHVPDPYLDEVFHIPQAQKYCQGRFWDWDDKITTPPGLYLVSVAYHGFWRMAQCTPSSLRSNNVLATLLTALLAAQCRHLIEVRAAERLGKQVPTTLSLYSYHTGLNIALFPVIFFFSALYYTDVASTLVVLAAYRNTLLRLGPRDPGLASGLWTVVLGVAALSMRQTNVFWVVVYMGGLEAVHVLRSVKSDAPEHLASVHDLPLDKSGPGDWLLCLLTIAIAALYNPARVVRRIWPHLAVLALFAGFVTWNGGVVLGDKSNHVATIHLAQMLYIWPFFAFFSAPLFIPAITHPLQYVQSLVPTKSWRSALVHISYTLLTTLFSLAVVKYNTIIHPFTLADNRHYMFYVFRYTILRSPARRLALVAAYTLCRWLVWDQLAGFVSSANTFPTTPQPSPEAAQPKPRPSPKSTLAPQRQQQPPPSQNQNRDQKEDSHASSSSSSSSPPPTSTALLWLLATALSLVTAPLVEPRYFILPWVFYRLLAPAWSWSWPCCSVLSGRRPAAAQGGNGGSSSNDGSSSSSRTGGGWGAWIFGREGVGTMVDVRLVLETAWFVVVNLGTMYMFLFRGFCWRGKDGEVLDGGRVQRFMW